MPEAIAPHVEFQYSDARHQADTAVVGMWLFLATEVLFFGGLILVWLFCRHWQQTGFDAGARETLIAFGTTNLVLLLTASLTFSAGLAWTRLGITRRLVHCCWLTASLGALFLVLKSIEWYIDIADHLFPTGAFKLTGAEADGARLFWSFYFVSTGLHAAHMIAGVGLLCWLALRARKGAFSAKWHTPVAVVGLYWSFVDIVWIVLYPLIYLIGRGA
jgi:cytochrome c oxidase subunit III